MVQNKLSSSKRFHGIRMDSTHQKRRNHHSKSKIPHQLKSQTSLKKKNSTKKSRTDTFLTRVTSFQPSRATKRSALPMPTDKYQRLKQTNQSKTK